MAKKPANPPSTERDRHASVERKPPSHKNPIRRRRKTEALFQKEEEDQVKTVAVVFPCACPSLVIVVMSGAGPPVPPADGGTPATAGGGAALVAATPNSSRLRRSLFGLRRRPRLPPPQARDDESDEDAEELFEGEPTAVQRAYVRPAHLAHERGSGILRDEASTDDLMGCSSRGVPMWASSGWPRYDRSGAYKGVERCLVCGPWKVTTFREARALMQAVDTHVGAASGRPTAHQFSLADHFDRVVAFVNERRALATEAWVQKVFVTGFTVRNADGTYAPRVREAACPIPQYVAGRYLTVSFHRPYARDTGTATREAVPRWLWKVTLTVRSGPGPDAGETAVGPWWYAFSMWSKNASPLLKMAKAWDARNPSATFARVHAILEQVPGAPDKARQNLTVAEYSQALVALQYADALDVALAPLPAPVPPAAPALGGVAV